MARALFFFAIATSWLLLASSDAHAKGKPLCKGKRDLGFAAAEAFVGALAIPSIAVNGEGTPRRLVGVAPPGSTEPMAGAGLGLVIRCDFMVVNIVGVRYAGPLGGATAGTARADDTTVNVSRGSLQTLAVSAPSFGLPTGFQLFPSDDTKFSFGFDYGAEHLWGNALVSGAGVPPSAGSVESWDLYLRAQTAVCMKLGHTIPKETMGWGCLALSATVYDRQPFPGATVGLRVDL